MSKIKISLIQIKVGKSKENNLKKAYEFVKKACEANPDIVVLPEMFTCPYETSNFPIYAEEDGGYSYKFLSNMAKENIYI